MRLRKIALALFAYLALGAFAANAAQAEGAGWTIGSTENQTTAGTLIPNGTHERINCRKHGTSSLILSTKLLGANIKLSATGIDCLEKAGSTNAATIDNTTSANHSEAVLTFTGVKVTEPSNCTVSEDLTTNLLTDTVIMDPTAGSAVVDKFFPEAPNTKFITITFAGALCPLAELPTSLTGTLCGEAVHTNAAGTGYEPNKTGTLTKVRTLLFGPAQQTTAGCEMKFGSAAAQFEGAVDNELSGTNAGKPFGSD